MRSETNVHIDGLPEWDCHAYTKYLIKRYRGEPTFHPWVPCDCEIEDLNSAPMSLTDAWQRVLANPHSLCNTTADIMFNEGLRAFAPNRSTPPLYFTYFERGKPCSLYRINWQIRRILIKEAIEDNHIHRHVNCTAVYTWIPNTILDLTRKYLRDKSERNKQHEALPVSTA